MLSSFTTECVCHNGKVSLYVLGKKIKSLRFNNLNYNFLWRRAKCLHRIWDPSLFLPFVFTLRIPVSFQHLIPFQFSLWLHSFSMSSVSLALLPLFHSTLCSSSVTSPVVTLQFSSWLHILLHFDFEMSLVISRSNFCRWNQKVWKVVVLKLALFCLEKGVFLGRCFFVKYRNLCGCSVSVYSQLPVTQAHWADVCLHGQRTP